MSYLDPNSDTMTAGGAGVPPLVGYGADSTLNFTPGADAIPGNAAGPGMGVHGGRPSDWTMVQFLEGWGP